MEIEELGNIDFQELIKEKIKDDSEEEEFVDIYKLYSSPYFATDDFEYLFKLSIENDEILLDEIKVPNQIDDLEESIDETSITILKNVCKIDMNEAFIQINKGIDIRDGNTQLGYNGETLCFDSNSKEELNELIKKNKLIVLSELYLDLLDESI